MTLVEIPGVPRGLHTVCWYHELQKNEQDSYLPYVNVVLRSQANSYSKPYFQEIPVAITYLGQVRIGYMVSGDGDNGFVDGTHPIPRERFVVDFTRDSWEFGEAGDLVENLPSDIPWLSGFEPRGPMLVFPLEDGCSLWIPCIEFFSRCYGRSQEIKRLLSVYPWERAEKYLLGSRVMPEDKASDLPGGKAGDEAGAAGTCLSDQQAGQEGGWTIRLKSPFVEDDAVFLAHVWHDPYAKDCAKWIYAQLGTALPRVPRPLPWKSFFRVRPWFEGPAELLVRGFWIGDATDRKFLALRVDGCSDPPEKPIHFVRNAKRASSGTAATGGEIPPFRKRRKPKEVRLTHGVEPDRDSPSVKVDDPPFEIVGGRQAVKEIKGDGRKTAVRLLPEGDGGSDLYSSSEPYSTGKDVGSVFFVAPAYQPMGDVLSDVWKTLLHLQEKHPDLVSSVAWVAERGSRFGYGEAEPPELIFLEPFGSEEDGELDRLDTRVLNWPWLDPKDPRRLGLRGLLVMRCLVRGHPVYFVEVQRRPGTQDNFSGMVFRLNRDTLLDEWLRKVCFRIRYVKGVFSNLCPDCPGRARDFIHFPPPKGTVLYEAAVVNALNKVGLDLPIWSAEAREEQTKLPVF